MERGLEREGVLNSQVGLWAVSSRLQSTSNIIGPHRTCVDDKRIEALLYKVD